MSVRITGLQEVSTLQSGDYIAVDNESNGTHKFDAMKMGANMASNIAPAYSTAATYAIGDFCMHDNILYKCTTAISTPESWTASHWTQTSAGVALAQKVDKVSGKGLSQNDFTNALKTKLDGIASGAEVNVQADWAQTNTSADDYIKNKPVDATSSVGGLMSASDKAKLDGIASGAEVNVQANWTETNTSSDAYIKNKPTNATSSTAGLMSAADKAKLDGIASGAEVNVQADWSQTNTSADDYIKNKPVDATSSVGGLMSATDKAKLDSIEQGAEVNVQADWNQTNTSADDYIKNKPTNATTSTAGLMSASDKTKLNGIETGAQVNVIDGVKVDGTLLTVDSNKDVDIVGKANQASLAPQYSSDTGNYVRGDYVIYQNNLYKCLQDTSGVWDATKWEQVDIGTELEDKANIDGLYEEMTVGGAEQLISDTFNIESVPYNFRTSGGSLDIGDRETDKLIGGTVAWNQLYRNWYASGENSGLTYTRNDDNSSYTINGTSTGTNSINFSYINRSPGHKYVIFGCPSGGGSSTYWLGISGAQSDYGNGGIYTTSNTGTGYVRFDFKSGQTFDNVKIYPQVIDLTAMFGSTIADYIYNLEQNTAGAGVAFFKKLFPASHYAYNAGQLMSVNAGSHVMNGFNQFDKTTAVANSRYNSSGTASANGTSRSDYIKCLPNTSYYFKNVHGQTTMACAYWFDSDKNVIKYDGIGSTSPASGIITSPSNAMFMGINFPSASLDDICVNIAWDGERNGEYEPYVSHTYELDDTLELRGIPKLDANNQLYYDGDVYESDGTVTRKYNLIDLKSYASSFSYSSETKWFYINASSFTQRPKGTAGNGYIANAMMVGYTTTSRNYLADNLDVDKMFAINTGGTVQIRNLQYTTVSDFVNSFDHLYLLYDLYNVTTDSATPYTNPQIVNDWGTETYTDYSYDAQTRDVQIPVGHETRYMANLKAKLEMAPESPNGDGDYIVRQTSGENAYVAIGSSPTIQHKAEIDGTYDDMNVGGAKQLLSNVFEEDQVPYTFRTSGGSIDIGDREYDEIVGGTIAWNQLYNKHTLCQIKSGDSVNITATVDSDGYANISGTPNETTVIEITVSPTMPADMVCLILCDGKMDGMEWGRIGFGYTTNSYFMNKHNTAFNCGARVRLTANTAYNIKVRFSTYNLTQMFGSTIADYIYSLEQATEGAGVAWFKKLFPKPYYANNAYELLSVEGVSSHDMTGFNQWDEEWESGSLKSADGTTVADANKVRSKNYIPLVNGATYYFKSPSNMTGFFYDANKNYLGYDPLGKDATYDLSAHTGLENVAYMKFTLGSSGSPVTSITEGTICINLHWDGERDGEYEPYVKYTYALDDSLTLRGVPKLDASNNLYYDGDMYESDGTVTRRYGIVDMGSFPVGAFSHYEYAGEIDGFTISSLMSGAIAAKKAKDANSPANCIVVGFNNTSDNLFNNSNNDKEICINTLGIVKIKYDGITTSSGIKEALSGVYLVYELETPTTETAEPFQSPQIVDDWGTEEYVTTSIVPVGHDTKYTANLRAKIEMAPDSPSGDGDYIVRQADGTNSYVPLVIPNELPTMPTTDGTYRLQVVVASGTPTLSWVSAT